MSDNRCLEKYLTSDSGEIENLTITIITITGRLLIIPLEYTKYVLVIAIDQLYLLKKGLLWYVQ